MDRIATERRGESVIAQEKLPEPSISEVKLPVAKPIEIQNQQINPPEAALVGIQKLAKPPAKEEVAHTMQFPADTKIVDVSKVFKTDKVLHNLGDLDLGAFKAMLILEEWTVEKLANAQISDLTIYSKIGETRAKAFIDQARKLINQI